MNKICAALSVVAGALLCPAIRGQAATYIVDNRSARSADTNAGTREAPFKTIGAAAKIVKPGDTVLVRPGLYREAVTLSVSGQKGQPITFRSEVPHAAIIDGADPITVFKAESHGVWSFEAPTIQSNPYWDDRSFGEWVYLGDEPLERVTDKTKLAPGTFWEDYPAKRVFIAPGEDSDIKGLKVEFATRDGLMAPAYRHSNTVQRLDDIHIIGFTLQHNADWFGGRPAINFRGARWLIEDNHVRWGSWGGISSEGTRDCIVRGNVVDWSGIEAIGGTANANLLVENNRFLHGNWRRGNPDFTGGASKWSLTIDSIVRGNEVAYNYGFGLWFDIHNTGDILEANICHDTLTGGTLFTEISDDILIRDNICFNNDTGIIVGESPATLVERNILFNNGLGINMRGNGTRQNNHATKASDFSPEVANWFEQIKEIPDLEPIRLEQYIAKYKLYWLGPKAFLTNNSLVRENLIFDNTTNYHEDRNYAAPSAIDPFINNFSDYNLWWNSNERESFHWASGSYQSFAAWQKASGRDENSLFADPRDPKIPLPDWAKSKRAIWNQKFRSPGEIDALKLELVNSPSAADTIARIRRTPTIKAFSLGEGIKAFLFEMDGQKILGLWTTKAGERRRVRLGLRQSSVIRESSYGVQTSRKIVDGALDVVVTHLPVYLRGVSEPIVPIKRP